MVEFDYKTIADPVYGSIGLSRDEIEIIETPAFQRLRNVKHHGLASFVFPGADFSRFTHSIGTCHMIGRTLGALQRVALSSAAVTDEEIQLYRLAALLHDVGHYPFSHSMENAVKNHYSSQLLSSSTEVANTINEADGEVGVRYYDHERAGKQVVTTDPAICKLIEATGSEPPDVSAVFMHEQHDAPKFANLLSSDLDADRIDYLLRTSRHTGLPYGAVDIDYLLTQLRFDGDG